MTKPPPFFLIATEPLDFEGAHRRYLKALLGEGKVCAACTSREEVKLEDRRTKFMWDGKGVDPNAPIPLCRPCARAHHTEMDHAWATYYGGLLHK